jgi:hypothetical protein
MNEELNHILQYCSANKLSINEQKTNFMLISSNKKNIRSINISHLVQKDYIKYLGMYIDKHNMGTTNQTC